MLDLGCVLPCESCHPVRFLLFYPAKLGGNRKKRFREFIVFLLIVMSVEPLLFYLLVNLHAGPIGLRQKHIYLLDISTVFVFFIFILFHNEYK